MKINLDPFHTDLFLFLFLCWVFFSGIFMLRKKLPKARESKRDRLSLLGIVLQGVSFAMIWGSTGFTITLGLFRPTSGQIALAILTVAILGVSIWLTFDSVRTLGKQWAYVARLVEGHKLITEGPYSLVRNPIYLGMFGMLVATGLALGRWWILPLACAIFLLGTAIRIRSEERLLSAAFGEEFEAYARRVPAFFPRL